MDIASVRSDFPLLAARPDLAYFDSAATAQRPACVLEAARRFYEETNANPLRGLYDLSQAATDAYESAREEVRRFLGAAESGEIIFTRNATESLNLVAYSYGQHLSPGDEIVVSVLEHHSNLLPWQQLAARAQARLRFVPVTADGRITEEAFRKELSCRTKIVAMAHVSNVLGTENDIRLFARLAHKAGAVFVCDGAQSVPHLPVNVRNLDVDFLAFSGHKMGGPMGIGVLYGKKELLQAMPPFLTGGEMIEYVTKTSATWAELPHKFEAGTVNAAGAVGLAAAIRYLNGLGWDEIVRREEELSEKTFEALTAIPHLHILGSPAAADHHGIFSFTIDGVHPHDIAEIANADGICLRAGHHCAQVLMQELHVPSTARVSVSFLNTEDEIGRLAKCLASVRERMGYAE